MSADSLASSLDARLVFPSLESRTREDILVDMARRLSQAGVVHDADDLARRLIEREALGCTGLGAGIAIPHCKLKDLSDVVVSIGRSPQGVDFHAADGVPVTILFLVLSPADAPALHLQALARVSRWLKTPGLAQSLRQARSGEEMVDAIRDSQASPAAVQG